MADWKMFSKWGGEGVPDLICHVTVIVHSLYSVLYTDTVQLHKLTAQLSQVLRL